MFKKTLLALVIIGASSSAFANQLEVMQHAKVTDGSTFKFTSNNHGSSNYFNIPNNITANPTQQPGNTVAIYRYTKTGSSMPFTVIWQPAQASSSQPVPYKFTVVAPQSAGDVCLKLNVYQASTSNTLISPQTICSGSPEPIETSGNLVWNDAYIVLDLVNSSTENKS